MAKAASPYPRCKERARRHTQTFNSVFHRTYHYTNTSSAGPPIKSNFFILPSEFKSVGNGFTVVKVSQHAPQNIVLPCHRDLDSHWTHNH